MKFSAARSLAMVCLMACLLAGLPAVQAQPPFLVADLNVNQPPLQFGDGRDEIETAGGLVFFTADDGIHGTELWASDGTPAGSYLVRDICPGACSARPDSLLDLGGVLYFIADDGVHGREIWRSDGTEDGTALTMDLTPGLGDGAVSLTSTVGPYIFGVLPAIGPFGQEPFRTDGTPAGTRTLGDLNPGREGSHFRFLATTGFRTLFVAYEPDHGGELWAWDEGTLQATLVMDIRPGPSSSLDLGIPPASKPDAITSPKGGAILFAANDGVHGSELWLSDGTDDGTYLLKDLAAGPDGAFPHGFTAVNGAVYFSATGPEGQELWRTDGTAAGTTLVKDINPGTPSSNPQELTAVGSLLFFLAYDPTFGEQLFRSDGTAAGTFRLQGQGGHQIEFGFSPPSGYARHGLSNLNGKLAFLADGSSGVLLWTSDGTSDGTLFATVVNDAAIRVADGYAVLGGNLYFRQGTQGQEVWRSDGTAPGTARVYDGPWVTSSFYLDGWTTYHRDTFAAFGGKLYFAAYDGTAGDEQLWRSDGTEAGTSKLENFDPFMLRPLAGRLVFSSGGLWSTDGTPEGAEPLPGFSFNLTTVGNRVFFDASDSDHGPELWKTDGTQAGTSLVADLVPGTAPSYPRLLTAVGSRLFFEAFDEGGSGGELWVSDGTAAGSFLVADLVPGAGSSAPENLTAAGNLLFFTARTSGFGRELWKSDGTGPSTVLVKDINPGDASSNPGDPVPETFAAPAGGPLFFVADDGVHGEELWTSDGTGPGTVLVKDISADAPGAQPRHLTAAGNKVYFVAADSAGRELWVSDGTTAGTYRVKDIVPGPESSSPDHLTADGSVLLFSAFDPDHGVEAWRTDGTAVGTRRITAIAPDAFSSSPLEFTPAGPNVYFAANNNDAGFELWAVPQSNVLATFEDAPTTYWAWRSVEAVAAAGITLGCGEGLFCTERTLTRAEMGVFLGRGLHGSTFVPPPATGTRFADVPASYWAADWIEQIATDGITQGCAVSPLRFCPEAQVARAEMAIFLLRARHGGAYTPPPATGTRFTDVPASFWAAAWIEQLAAEGITNGCDVNLYCPNKTVGRAEMAVFLARAFNLPLP